METTLEPPPTPSPPSHWPDTCLPPAHHRLSRIPRRRPRRRRRRLPPTHTHRPVAGWPRLRTPAKKDVACGMGGEMDRLLYDDWPSRPYANDPPHPSHMRTPPAPPRCPLHTEPGTRRRVLDAQILCGVRRPPLPPPRSGPAPPYPSGLCPASRMLRHIITIVPPPPLPPPRLPLASLQSAQSLEPQSQYSVTPELTLPMSNVPAPEPSPPYIMCDEESEPNSSVSACY